MALWSAVVFMAADTAAVTFGWSEETPLPAAISGHAAGRVGDLIVVAGGSSFPVSPFQGGEKHWHDTVYALTEDGAWQAVATLPAPRAYGAAAVAEGALWIAGGTDGVQAFDDVVRIARDGGAWTVTTFPDILPGPVAFMGYGLAEGRLHLIGGQPGPESAESLTRHTALRFDGGAPVAEELAELPGPPRILPQAAGLGGRLFVFGGATLRETADGAAARTYLEDGWRYEEGSGWVALAPLPQALAAAPAVPFGANHVVVLGGDDGALFDDTPSLGDGHPGFTRTLHAYHAITDAWTPWGELPEGLVTTQAFTVDRTVYLPGGEDRPGHRSDRVWVGRLEARAGAFGTLDYAGLAFYFAILVAIGGYFARREKSTEIFFLGGRTVPWWAVGLSIFGTSLSAITYLSIPAQAYATNWVWALANLGILFVAPFVAAFYIPRFRAQPISTAYEYLELRFNLVTRIYGSLCFFSFQIGRVGIVLLLPSIALSAATGINVYYAILAMGILTTVYTVLGGIEAVIWTDVMQAVVLVAGAVVALALIVLRVDGGAPEILAVAAEADKFHFMDWTLDMTTTALWVVVVGNALANLYPSTADQTIVQRYLSTADEAAARRAVWTNALLTLPITFLFFGLGTALWVYFREFPGGLDPRLQNDAILPLFIVEQFPAGLKGIVIAGIFAAAMSSLDSSINSVSSVLVNDYYRRFRRNVSERNAMRAARIITVVFGIVGTLGALYVARFEATSLWDPFLKLLSLVGGGLSGIFALGVFTRRANGYGAVAAAVASTAAVAFAQQTPVHFFLHAGIGFATAVVVGYAVSLATGGAARNAPMPSAGDPP